MESRRRRKNVEQKRYSGEPDLAPRKIDELECTRVNGLESWGVGGVGAQIICEVLK